jgi:hypothetical protein
MNGNTGELAVKTANAAFIIDTVAGKPVPENYGSAIGSGARVRFVILEIRLNSLHVRAISIYQMLYVMKLILFSCLIM